MNSERSGWPGTPYTTPRCSATKTIFKEAFISVEVTAKGSARQSFKGKATEQGWAENCCWFSGWCKEPERVQRWQLASQTEFTHPQIMAATPTLNDHVLDVQRSVSNRTADSNCLVNLLSGSCSLCYSIKEQHDKGRSDPTFTQLPAMRCTGHCISHRKKVASILQLCYIGLLITDIAFMLGNFYNTVTGTLVHNGVFVYLGDSRFQIRVNVSSLYRKKRGLNKEVGGNKRSRVNILTIKTDLSLRVKRGQRSHSFGVSLWFQRTGRWPKAVTRPEHLSKTENTLGTASTALL